jgi:excisionase family DNA binding protein
LRLPLDNANACVYIEYTRNGKHAEPDAKERDDMADMLSTREAADRLNITDSSVRRLILAGQLRAEKRGRDWWVPADALDDVRRRPVGRPVTEATAARLRGQFAALRQQP